MAENSLLRSNLVLRIMTAIVTGPLVIALVVLSWCTTALLFVVLILLALYEYIHLVRQRPSSTLNNVLFGTAYLGIPLAAALWLRGEKDSEIWFLLMLFANWMTDIAAFLAGRFFGKTLLAPKISPKKTWEGVIGGLVMGFAVTLVAALVLDFDIKAAVIVLAIGVPIATILGDLLESKLKRHFQVKDSGNILPGHGGILDRIDGTLLALPVAALVVALIA